jgi:hypothetical protein
MTSSFLEIMRSKLKGCLRATTKQISIAIMAKEYNIEESNIFMIVEELIKEESIDGKLQGGTFVPNKFLKNQDLIIK